jgi:hypothetical protein
MRISPTFLPAKHRRDEYDGRGRGCSKEGCESVRVDLIGLEALSEVM